MRLAIYTLLFTIFLSSSSIAQLSNYNVGDIAPNFTITDLSGTSHSLYQYTDSGKYVLLDFFGYWCGTCRIKAPIIQKFYSKYGCNNYEVVVLGIEGDGTNAQLLEFDSLSNLPIDSYPACSGLEGNGDSVHTHYGVSAFPTLVIISPDRKIINENIFPSNTAPEILAAFPENSVLPHLCDPNSIAEDFELIFSVFPSPTTGKIFLTSNSNAISLKYFIMNITGEIIIRGETQKTISEIDLSNLVDGFYVIVIENEWNSRVKIVKVNG
ncbi:MAG: redoxin domain-containing protein [Bacteroidota bacterium]